MDEFGCEVPGCSMPASSCPACDQYLCWQHRQRSSCEVCHKLLSHASFEHHLGRLLTIGFSVLLCGVLFLLLPRDDAGTMLQLAIFFLVAGSLLMWLGWLAHV